MAKRLSAKDTTEAAPAASVLDIRRATPETWPFGTARGPVEGFLRSLDPNRTGLIQDFGESRLYPPYSPGGPPRLVQRDYKTKELRCSGDGCEYALEDCVHCWEDRFRFRDLKGGNWVVPIALTRHFTKKGGQYEGVKRYLPRPNPTVDGLKFSTIATHARIARPVDVPSALFAAAAVARRQRGYDDHLSGVRRGRGRPGVDVYDLAVMALLRLAENLSYEQLQERINRYARDGAHGGPLLQEPFDYKRVVDAMTGHSREDESRAEDLEKRARDAERLTVAMEHIRDRFPPFFGNVVTVVGCDGMVLSTGATDNARKNQFDKSRGHQVLAHMMYDLRWGIVVAQRLTWFQRGRGSAESPQYPYLLSAARSRFPGIDTVLADMAYGSARNRAISLVANVRLYCEIKESQFEGEAALKWLKPHQIAFEKEFCSLANPLFRQVMPFRNRTEGWHEVQRNQISRSLKSRVDRGNMPLTRKEKTKENPLRADLELPEDTDERERIIREEQFVSRACHNEMLGREILSYARALVDAQGWYKTSVDFWAPQPFQPRPEDEAFSIFRPRIDPQFGAA